MWLMDEIVDQHELLAEQFEAHRSRMRAVAEQALTFSRHAEFVQPALVNGAAGIVSWLPGGRPFAIMGFTVRGGKIVEINILADPVRLRQLDLAALDD